MSLKNPTDKKILFKIKTTAPKKYCVRPNCGAIDPKSSVEIASKLSFALFYGFETLTQFPFVVCLQPFVFDPNEKNKHKFMVQSLVAPDGEINTEQLWKDVSPDQLMDAKLRCLFENPVEKAGSKDGSSLATVSQLTTQMLKNESMMSDSLQSTGSGDVPEALKLSGGNTSDFARATTEVRELREENSKMQQENLELKVSFA